MILKTSSALSANCEKMESGLMESGCRDIPCLLEIKLGESLDE
jgi:hypothetical protein